MINRCFRPFYKRVGGGFTSHLLLSAPLKNHFIGMQCEARDAQAQADESEASAQCTLLYMRIASLALRSNAP